MLWYQVICANAPCTNVSSRQASAKAHMYFRLRGEKPATSGPKRFTQQKFVNLVMSIMLIINIIDMMVTYCMGHRYHGAKTVPRALK